MHTQGCRFKHQPYPESQRKIAVLSWHSFGSAFRTNMCLSAQTPRNSPQRTPRLGDRGGVTIQAGVLIGTLGLLGAGYFGFHNNNTGRAIRNLVPEWRVPSVSFNVDDPPACTKPPAPEQSTHAVPNVAAGYTLPMSDQACALFMGAGAIKLRVNASGRWQEAQSQACDRHGAGPLSVSLGLDMCPFTANVQASGSGSHSEKTCKRCSAPPVHTCGGSKCAMDAYAAQGVVKGDYAWSRPAAALLGVEGTLKFHMRVSGNVAFRKSETKSGSVCGRCTDPDCTSESATFTFSDMTASVNGEAQIGKHRTRGEGTCTFAPNMSLHNRSATCSEAAGGCSNGNISLSCRMRFRPLDVDVAITKGTPYWIFDCKGTWGGSQCGSLGASANTPWACTKEAGFDPV